MKRRVMLALVEPQQPLPACRKKCFLQIRLEMSEITCLASKVARNDHRNFKRAARHDYLEGQIDNKKTQFGGAAGFTWYRIVSGKFIFLGCSNRESSVRRSVPGDRQTK
jgi:hypothetical protein